MRTIALVLVLLLAGQAAAHSGGTDAYGCHTDSRYNDYHCHGDYEPHGDGKCDGSCPVLAALALVAGAGLLVFIFWPRDHAKPPKEDAKRARLLLTPAGAAFEVRW